MSSYFAVNHRAVLNYFNPYKTKQFILNFINTIQSLHNHDPYARKCFRSIYLVLLFQSIFQLYLYLFPFPEYRLIFFDMFEESNNYPNLFKLCFSGIILLAIYMFHMLYVEISGEKCFQLFYEYYMHDAKTFVRTSSSGMTKFALAILNVYQIFPMLLVVFLCSEYIIFTLQIFHDHSLLVWTQWIEFACMNIFFVAVASALCLFVFICCACICCGIIAVVFLVFRFRETHRPLSQTYGRLTTLRLLRFVHQNIGTMQYIFSLNRLYGPILLAFFSANLPLNVIVGTYLLQNRFSAQQMIAAIVVYIGQLTCFFGVHLVAAAFSKNIHSPFKRFQSLFVRIQQCPLRARIHLANAIQTFHVKKKKYGITYGCGKWIIGLVTMMSFTKFILLYGKLLMSLYNRLRHSS